MTSDHRSDLPTGFQSVAAAGGIAVSIALAGWGFWQDHAHGRAIEHDRALVASSERLLSALKDVETGERGFIITGRNEYLEPYEAGSASAAVERSRTESLGAGEARKLSELVSDRLWEASEAIATYRREGAAAGAAATATGRGKISMDRVRAEVARIERDADGRISALHGEQRVDDGLRIASVFAFLASSGVLGLLAMRHRRERQVSQGLFEGVLENAPVGLGILDASLRIVHVNPSLARMSERALDAAPGMSIWDVIPDLRSSLEDRLRRVVEGGRPASAEVEAASNVRTDEVRSYEATFYPLRRGARGSDAGGVGMVIHDVTARRRAERATREGEERFRSLAEASTAMIWTADAGGAFVRAQPGWTRFTGQPEAASLGWGRLDRLHPDDVGRTREAWRVATDTASPIALEYRVRRSDGEWRHMALSVAPVLQADGTVREWVGSDTDITGRKEAELALSAAKEAAEAANRAKSTFLANMSHELRTPLSAVIGYAEMLEEEAEEADERATLADLGKIKSNAKHLLGLINDVLDLSKVEANRIDVHPEDLAVADFVRDAVSTLEPLIAAKGNTLVVDLGDDVGAMRTDAVKLRQCLFNLVGNAAKFTRNGTITLEARREDAREGDWIAFAVRDTGIGMSPEQLGRLFERFSQADETTTRKFGGTGLGLALSRGFARLLGGDIAVESVEGEGTCFSVRVPARMPEKLPTPLESEHDGVPEASRGEGDLVLVIDDEASQRELMTRFLEKQGLAVRTAADGETGIALARSLSPLAVLLDVMMPGMDGWAVLQALKDDPATSSIPVVMVSFVADVGIGASLGAVDAVAKPVDWTRLKGILDGLRETGDVLVVDDDVDTRRRLRSVLERSGWSVREAGDGAEALEHVTRSPPHLVLLDLTMPVMDGFSFLHRLRQTPGCSEIPVVVLSARDITSAERERLSGADRILSKGGTSMRDLTAELRRLDDHADLGAGRGA